jgi:MYXO-CTERM domain-containing protein
MLSTPFEDGVLSCSATLVAKNLVLTVRHCVSYATPGGASCTLRGELLDDGSGGGHLGLHLPSEQIEFYSGDGAERRLVARGKSTISTVSETICIDDVAFVVLDRDVDLPLAPLRLDTRAQVGEPVTLVGYGLDETQGFETELDELGRRAKDDLVILDVGPPNVDEVTSAPPRTILVRAPAGCTGDSGGPLFSTASGAILGVYSVLIGDSCESRAALNTFPHIPDYLSLVDDAFAEANATPLPEPIPQEFGASCEVDSDCAQMLCKDVGREQPECTRTCEESDDCPRGYECSAESDGHCVSEPPAHGAAGAASSGGETAGAAGQPGSPPDSPPRRDGGGCGMHASSEPRSAWVFALLVVGWACARRRQKPSAAAV